VTPATLFEQGYSRNTNGRTAQTADEDRRRAQLKHAPAVGLLTRCDRIIGGNGDDTLTGGEGKTRATAETATTSDSPAPRWSTPRLVEFSGQLELPRPI